MRIVKGLDGREHKWTLSSRKANSSKLQTRAVELVRDLFGNFKILEEVAIPGCGKKKQYADIFIPKLNMLIEVHGRQHTDFVHHFHRDILKFAHAKENDAKKKLWCEINDITYIELHYWESEDEWRQRLCDIAYGED